MQPPTDDILSYDLTQIDQKVNECRVVHSIQIIKLITLAIRLSGFCGYAKAMHD